jgi:nucleotide-binding universal stress UspA family protein
MNAYSFALDIAEKMKANILTLHTYLPTVTQPEIQFPFSEDAVEMLNLENYREAADLMHKIAAQSHHEDIDVQHTMAEGFPVESILRTAQESNASAIVMGSKGSSGIAPVVLGSTATSIVQKSNVPVFIVPDEYKGGELKKMGLAINLLTINSTYVDQAIDLASVLNLPLTCFHVDTNHSPKLIEKIDAWRESYSPTVKFDTWKNHYVLDGINEYVDNNDIDLLVMITRKHSFLNNLLKISRTKRMALHTKVPVCIMKR